MNSKHNYDVIVVGGSYAGLSAAMALGRSLRNVLILDSGLPCNRQTPHSHNFLTQDGITPAKIASVAKEQVLQYKTVQFKNDLALSGAKASTGFVINTEEGHSYFAKKLVFATGIKDIMAPIDGFSECWGISVIHCPYCHGYEVKDNITGILANGEFAYHYAQLVNNLTKKLTIFTNGKAEFTAEQTDKLEQHQIPVIETPVKSLRHKNGYIEQIIFRDDSTFAVNALYARPIFEQHCKIPELLGCEVNEMGLFNTNGFQKTNIEGIYVCGDNCNPMRSVANAVASGNLVGAMINRELISETF